MSAAGGEPDATLAGLFEAHRGHPWLFVRPGGNFGDHLIYAGAERLASALKLRWATCDARNFDTGAITPEHCIYLHGGGGYNTWGSGRPFRNLAHAVSRASPLVVQGPQTLESASAAIKDRIQGALRDRRCERLVFFARERYSLAALSAMSIDGMELAVDHDTAFHLATRDVLDLAGLSAVPLGRYELTAYREDDERPGTNAGTPARGVVLDPAYAAASFSHWLRIHLFATRVLSNRLHSCIVSSLVGKPVTLAFGSYHKNRSIWDYSLAARGVDWTEGILAPRTWWSTLPRRLKDSHKLGKLKLMLRGVPVR
jgi:hypothetical protein